MLENILTDECFRQKFPIILVSHNDKWKQWYNEEEIRLSKLLKGIPIRIYHIGSTAIPSIKSKNIIDILNVEWELRWKEDNKAFLVKGYGDNGFQDKVYHLHVRKKGDIEEVKFRDILIENPKIAKQYEKLKLCLELTYKYDREGYTEGKTEFINNITKEHSLHK